MAAETDSSRVLLGIDIGGTKTVVALARADGQILAESRLESWTCGSWEQDVRTIEEHARVLLRGAGIPCEAVHAIGVSAPGPLDPVKGIVLDAPNIAGWRDVPLVEALFRAFGVQVLLENDANAAALAEWRFGAGQGARSLIYVTMSTGCGGGLILEGRVYRGTTFQAGEIGHIPVAPGGRPCGCGLRGCLEAYVGGAAIAGRIREDVRAGRAGRILELAGGDPDRISARTWIEALRAGDTYSGALREEFLDHLSQGLAMLIPILDPDRILLGTIVRENPDLFMEDLRDRVHSLVWPSLRHVEIRAAELGDRLPAYAALCVAALEPPDLAPPDALRP